MKSIDLMIIGAQKAGTTSLKNYLGEHPLVSTHLQTEFGFYRDHSEFAAGYDMAFKKYFQVESNSKIVAKNAGMYYEMESIKRLREHNPDCKLVFLLREPVSRLVSAYKMEKYNGWLEQSIEDFVSIAERRDDENLISRIFLRLGEYSKSLDQITEYFPMSQIKLIDYQQLKSDPNGVCKGLFYWLNVKNDFIPNTEKKHNESKAAKSKRFSSVIRSLRSESNVLKRTAKKILPQQTFAKIGNRIIESNKSSKDLEVSLTDQQMKIFKNFYKEDSSRLQSKYKFDISGWS